LEALSDNSADWMIWFSGLGPLKLLGLIDRHQHRRSQSNRRRDRLYPNKASIGASVAGLF
jgi:hypothetical protein